MGFPQIKRTVVEREMDEILNQYAGAGYGARRGVINLIFYEGAPLPTKCDPKEIDSCLLGMIMVNQYSLKKGREFFSDCTDEAIMNELSKIGSLKIYEPQGKTYEPKRIEGLTAKDTKRTLESLLLISKTGLIRMITKRPRAGVWR